MRIALGRGLSGARKGPPPGCCPHIDAEAVDGTLDRAGAGRGEHWGRPGHSGCQWGAGSEPHTAVSWISVCVWAAGVISIRLLS